MSEESKKVFDNVENAGFILDKAVEITKEYAGSGNANPDYIPELLERLVHLFAAGERDY